MSEYDSIALAVCIVAAFAWDGFRRSLAEHRADRESSRAQRSDLDVLQHQIDDLKSATGERDEATKRLHASVESLIRDKKLTILR